MSAECVDLNELISAYVDGELAGEQLERVESHLEGCADCRGFVEACRRIDRAVAAEVPPPPVEKARWDAMLAQLRAARGPAYDRRHSKFRLVKAFAFVCTAAAVCLICIVPIATDNSVRHPRARPVISIEYSSPDCPALVLSAPEGGLSMVVVTDQAAALEAEADDGGEAGPEKPVEDKGKDKAGTGVDGQVAPPGTGGGDK
jgi:hypothetical protein